MTFLASDLRLPDLKEVILLKNKMDRYFIAGFFGLALAVGGCAAKDVNVRTQGDSTSVRGRGQSSTDSDSGTNTDSGTRRSGGGTTSGSGSFGGSGSGSVSGSGSGTSQQAE
jgi:hypothetical protein